MFGEVIGQHDVQKRLLQMYSEKRLPHAVMLCGPQGSGKLALAVEFAKVLLSAGPRGSVTLEEIEYPSPNTKAMLDKLEHPDLHFTYPTIKLPSMSTDHKPVSDDFASEWHQLVMGGLYFGMNTWLEQMGGENQQAIITAGESDSLTHKLSLKSSQGGYKVSIVWLPERMNQECANKLLKLLEEPPQQTVFILVCEDPGRLLDTIRSRVQRIDVPRIATDDISRELQQRRGLAAESAERVARMANGSWLTALELISSDSENEQFLDLFQVLMRKAWVKSARDLKAWSERMAQMGRERQRRFLEYFLRMVRESFMYNFKRPELCYMTQREEQFASKFAPFVNERNVLAITDLVQRSLRDIGQNANARIVFFDIALQMTILIKNS